jgi:hypothetical protein
MRYLFVYIGNRLNRMPSLLYLLILLCVFAPIFAFGFSIRDDPQAPIGLPEVLLIVVGSAVFAYGFLRATRWSRPLLMLYLVIGSSWAIFMHHATYSFSNYFALLVTDGFIVWILYFRRDVRDYYARMRESVD